MQKKSGLERVLQTLAGLTIATAISCGPKNNDSKPFPGQPPVVDAFVFVSDRDDPEGEIYYKELGGVATRLTSYAGIDAAPALSPDGSKVAFHRAISNITWDVYVAFVDGSSVVRVTDDPSIHFRYPDWSPDGKSLVMEGAISSLGEYDLFISDYDKNNPRDITSSLPTIHERRPKWSYRGDRISFIGTSTTFWDDLYAVDKEGNSMAQFTDDPAFEYGQRWSADDSRIAYTKWDSDVEVYFVQSDGGVETNVSSDPGSLDGNSGWLDDNTIVWLKYTGVFGEIYSKNLLTIVENEVTPTIQDMAIGLRVNDGKVLIESRRDDIANSEIYSIDGSLYQNETNNSFDDRFE